VEDDLQESLLGTLRSELDDDDAGGLHPSFEVLAGLVVSVRTAYTSFRISPEQAARICALLRLEGQDGNEWTVGATSGAWFRRRVGERPWQKAMLPLNVAPVDGTAPAWLTDGVGGLILEAENANKQAAANATADKEADGGDAMAGMINPFQRTVIDEQSVAAVGVTTGSERPHLPGGSIEDVDWLLEEWEEIEQAAVERGPAGRLGALAPELDPDQAYVAALGTDGPTEREGATTAADGPVDRDGPLSPDDFFLRPED